MSLSKATENDLNLRSHEGIGALWSPTSEGLSWLRMTGFWEIMYMTVYLIVPTVYYNG